MFGGLVVVEKVAVSSVEFGSQVGSVFKLQIPAEISVTNFHLSVRCLLAGVLKMSVSSRFLVVPVLVSRFGFVFRAALVVGCVRILVKLILVRIKSASV